MWIAISVEFGPGMILVAPSMSRNSPCEIHLRRRTNSSSIIAMCSAGPPNAVAPRRRNESAIRANSAREATPATSGPPLLVSSRVIGPCLFIFEEFREQLAYLAFGFVQRLPALEGGPVKAP